jgi:uncharacterized repeat protein (TIGR01451 family)
LAFALVFAGLCIAPASEFQAIAQSSAGIDLPTIADRARLAGYEAVWQEPTGQPAGYYAPNRRHNFMSAFTVYGAVLSPRQADDQRQWLWALRPAAIGAADLAQPLPAVAQQVDAIGQRVEIEWGDLLSEWYRNDERGIEHGFVIYQRPTALANLSTDLLLRLEMHLLTNLSPVFVGDDELRFLDGQGKAILRYADLHVFDADGYALPARFTLKPIEHNDAQTAGLPKPLESHTPYALAIFIDERDARYPLLVDPLITGYERRLTASDGADNDQFGASVALNGDTLVVGAPNADVGINLGQGAAYVFERNQSGPNAWGEVKRLIAGDGAAFDGFGGAVAVDGDVIVVGAAGDNVGDNTDQGAAYLFGRNHGGVGAWGQLKKIVANDGAPFDRFGVAAAISDDTVVVGASSADVDGRLDQGAAYIFARNQSGMNAWGEVTRIFAADGGAGAFFGGAVALEGETVVVGASGAKPGENVGQGAAYLFQRDQGGANVWGQTIRLTGDDSAAFDGFGSAVAVRGEFVLAGAPSADVQGRANQGAAYLFRRNHGGADAWGEVKKLLAVGGVSNDRFGDAVALDADMAMVGARASNIGVKNDQGSAYLFERNHGGADAWGQLTRITGADGAANDGFGAAVAVEGSLFVAGAPGKDVGGGFDQGATYLFDLQISRVADLHIAKSTSPASAAPGAFITYTLSFENLGPGGAIDILVQDSLPPEVSLASVITSVVGQGVRIVQTGAAPDLSWMIPWLDRGDGGAITLRTQIHSDWALDGLILTNTAAITATNDVTPSNNTASATVAISAPKAHLTVTKVVVNDNGGTKQAGDFLLFVNGAALESGRAVALSMGVYTVTETTLPGYSATFQGDCSAAGRVTLAPGDVKTCTLVNDDQPATLTVNKVVINDNGGSAQVGDFPLFINETPTTSGVAVMLDAGEYAVTEESVPGYTASFSGDCDADGRVILSVGEAKTCMITNDDGPIGSFAYLPVVMR